MESLRRNLDQLQLNSSSNEDFEKYVESYLLIFRNTSEHLETLYGEPELKPYLKELFTNNRDARFSSEKFFYFDEWVIEILSQLAKKLEDTTFKFDISSEEWVSVIRIYLEKNLRYTNRYTCILYRKLTDLEISLTVDSRLHQTKAQNGMHILVLLSIICDFSDESVNSSVNFPDGKYIFAHCPFVVVKDFYGDAFSKE